jgi:DNA helicase II / ATP-dependent DNA helicase PcrA
MPVNDEIYNCLSLDNPKSFFLFAGAGSGKTRSLVEVLKRFRSNNIIRLRRNAQKIAIITYTNAACDEIKRRLEFDSAFHVSTIHSFSWELVKPYTSDIKDWLKNSLEYEISELEDKQITTKNTKTKTYTDRTRKIELKNKRINSLEVIHKFSYNPNGVNSSRNSLNHSEVIGIASFFLMNFPLMQRILALKYPFLLIDESQDTKKELIEAFLEVQHKQSKCFALGMFGDTMQRIYTDGKTDLGMNDIPDSWAKPKIIINHRSPSRIVALINKIRAEVDNQSQDSKKKEEGLVRLFIVDASKPIDKNKIESEITLQMADLSGDAKWNSSQADVKVLTLEHHLAAKRGGFSNFFDPLYAVEKLKTGLLDGTLPEVSFFSKQILPLIQAKQDDDKFALARIVRKYSPLLTKEVLQYSSDSIKELNKAYDAVNKLFSLWNNKCDPSLNNILKEVFRNGLFQIPDSLVPIAKRLTEHLSEVFAENSEETDKDIVIDAWDEALNCQFSQLKEYVRYINDESRFGTHQGIKGLEFPRVMVILDDEEARGFLFSYEKLFGAREPSETDIRNQKEGKETSIERTRRLLYVTCSRAQESLAIVAYTKEPDKIQKHATQKEWFSNHEVIYL